MADGVTFKLEGLEQTVRNLDDMSRATQRNVTRRALLEAGEITANVAASIAPEERGVLAFSIVVSKDLTRRHKREQKNRPSEVEVYIGPSGGQGALQYASFVEFGTNDTNAKPYLRPAWDSTKTLVEAKFVSAMAIEVGKAAKRAERKAARLAARV